VCRVYITVSCTVCQNLNILGIRTLLRTSNIALKRAMSFQSSREISTYGKWQRTSRLTKLADYKTHTAQRPATVMPSNMAEPRDVTDIVANPSCRKLVETAERFHSNIIAFRSYSPVTRQMLSFQF
jgi:hypothetical protein